MGIILFIDTSHVDTAVVSVDIDGKKYTKQSQSRVVKSQMVLPLIEDLLSEQHMRLTDVKAITVIIGPGSFTGIRVGITVANTLGFLLGIPVNGKKTLAIPTYT